MTSFDDERDNAWPLLGRERECAVIDGLLDGARSGVSGALVIRGEPGIGKSALLEYAAGRAAPMAVLSAAGVQAESDLAFAGLHELLRPVLGHMAELPDNQAQALAGALGMSPSTHADRLLISAAVLGLLAAAAEDQPTLCVVDDAQWLDQPSAGALMFTARRLRADPVAIVFAARDGEPSRFEAAGVPELTLGGLAELPAAEILAARARSAAPSVRDRLLSEAAGNPLALLELPGGLSDQQLHGTAPVPDAIPLTPRLEEVFKLRAGRLSREAQTMLLIAAADNSGDAPAVLRAAAELRLPANALDPAERAGLVRVTGARITFRHPLVRSALYQAATLHERQQAHMALASALHGDENTDRRVWHQAMASLTGDEEVAAAMEASARRAQLRAGHSSAATAFLRAAELSTDETRRVRRIAAAAEAAWAGGESGRAREAISRALPLAVDGVRTRLLYLSGVIEVHTGSVQKASAMLMEAAAASEDPSLTIDLLYEAAGAATVSCDLPAVVKLSDQLTRITAVDELEQFKLAALSGLVRWAAGEHDAARLSWSDALSRAAGLTDPRALMWATEAAGLSLDPGAGVAYCNRAVDLIRRDGLLSLLPAALRRLAFELWWSSQLDLAYVAAQEGYRLSLDLGHNLGGHLVIMAAVEAAWGREQDARDHAEEALALCQRGGPPYPAFYAEWTLGLLDLNSGRPAEAARRLFAVTSPDARNRHPVPYLGAMPDALEAGARAGLRDETASRMDDFRTLVAAAPTPKRLALLARCEALLGTRDADAAFGDAIASGSLPPFQRGRTELLYGEWLRRERRPTESRAHLRAALDVFQRMGALPWAARAEAELRATGETIRNRQAAQFDRLTPQEHQIAELVCRGMTNREIAAQLYLSPRTVEYHLHKVFTKLRIGSRAELVRDGLPDPDLR